MDTIEENVISLSPFNFHHSEYYSSSTIISQFLMMFEYFKLEFDFFFFLHKKVFNKYCLSLRSIFETKTTLDWIRE